MKSTSQINNMLYNHITELIGNTPLLKIDEKVHGLKNIELYAKLEMYNPFGSIKDRIAWGILKDHIDDIQNNNKSIIESSSGNTAKALQALAGVFGIPFKTVTNRIKVSEVKDILQIMGAAIEEFPGRSECPDPNDPNDPLAIIGREVQANKDSYFYPSQYTNERNPQTHYETTGVEILRDLPQVDYFIGTLGTTGSTQGTLRRLKEANENMISIGIVGEKGDFIPGIRNYDELWEVGLFNKELYKEIKAVSPQAAIDGMLSLVRKAGVLCGPTSGACFQGAVEYLQGVDQKLTEKKKAVFIVCDRMEWYGSYIKERRPDLFGLKKKIGGIYDMTPETLANAPSIKIDAVEKYLALNKPLIIDMRSNVAFAAVRIPSSISIPEEQLKKMMDGTMPFAKGQKVLFVCPTGNQSKIFSSYLHSKGYESLSLDGGITAWRDSGLPLELGK